MESLVKFSLEEPRGGKVSGESFIGVDGDVGETGPPRLSALAMLKVVCVEDRALSQDLVTPGLVQMLNCQSPRQAVMRPSEILPHSTAV